MKMTFEEKVHLLDGLDVWHTKPLKELPKIMMADGPHGLRKQVTSTDNLGVMGSIEATAFPTASLSACSFDRKLVAKMAELIAIEAQSQDVNIVLGPAINIKRTPLCGRNFEYFSEDPYLTGELGAAYVRAMEDMGTGTSVKHFFCNNQEKNRFFIDSIVDERAMHEIYLSAFKNVVKEQPASIMASYNKINGYYGTEHPILKHIVRNDWKYQGLIVSDWGAIHNKALSIKATCDLEMPSSMGYHAKQVIEQSKHDEDLVNAVEASAARVAKTVMKYHQIPKRTYDSKAHHEQSRIIARESMVLLKNDGILPLNKDEKVAFIGGFVDEIRYQGGGSSHINPYHLDQINQVYDLYSDKIVWTKGYTLVNQGYDERLMDEAVVVADGVDKVVLVLGLPDVYETEGFDREHLDLPYGQIHLLQQIAKYNPNIVVVMLGGSVINLSFEPLVKGLLMSYLGGEASSKAILDLLYGMENPSGRLAETFIDDIAQCNVQLNNNNNAVYYDESIFVGYRYYQTFNQKVRYPFGYGLSYTCFEYTDFQVLEEKDVFKLSINIKNVGKVAGKEVIQIYVENNVSSVVKAKRELKQFDKIHLEPEEEKTVEIILAKNAFSYFDLYQNRFILQKGIYQIQLAKNADEIIKSVLVDVDGEIIEHESTSYHNSTYDTSDFKKIYQKPIPEV
ncbi:MAG: glycoside hydrolase family 3 C-terminal domain-containing protein, partial [Acholeplasmataceae bacterium]|nr:glycoside hydrolase family 3 C-terminal domain-containing protein [Acholeplasmataceae bacterium]